MDNTALKSNNLFIEREEDTSIDYKALLRHIIYNWYWVFLFLTLSMAASWLYLRYQDNMYQVVAKVLIKDEKNKKLSEEAIAGGLSSIATQGFGSNRAIDDEIQLLKSVKLMRRVVDSLDLSQRVYVKGRVKTAELYGRPSFLHLNYFFGADSLSSTVAFDIVIKDSLNFEIIDENQKTQVRGQFGYQVKYQNYVFSISLNNTDYLGSECRIEVYNPQVIAKRYVTNLKVSIVEKSNALEIKLSDNIPSRGIAILEQLIKTYNENNLLEKNAAGRQTLDFVDERLSFITNELYDVERDVESYKKENKLGISITEQTKSILSKVTEGDKELAKIETQISILDNYRQFLSNDNNKYKSLPIPSEWFGNNSEGIIKDYNTLIAEREQYLKFAKPDNPVVASMDDKFNRLRQTIILSLQTLRTEFELQRQRIAQELKPIEGQISLIPKNERELLNIMRQQRIKETLFLFLLQKREETALSVAAQTANAQFLEKPFGATLLSPKKMQTYTIAFVIGLIFPLILLYVIFALDNKISTKEDIANITSAPFLGVIGLSRRKEQLVVSKGNRSSIAEMFRLLRTNLLYLSNNKAAKTIMVTSTISGDGKSFISINLASTIAISGKKTLILGLDLRKPKMSFYIIGKKALAGVTNYLVGDTDWRSLIQKVEGHDSLYFLDSGPIPPNPSELLVTEKMKKLFAELKNEFEFIVVDTAPIALVADALLLKDDVDQTIIVTRFKRTTTELLRLVDDVYRGAKIPNIGIVLNAVNTEGVYGYGYGYGYSYGYGAGYYDEGANLSWWRRLLQFRKKSISKKK